MDKFFAGYEKEELKPLRVAEDPFNDKLKKGKDVDEYDLVDEKDVYRSLRFFFFKIIRFFDLTV